MKKIAAILMIFSTTAFADCDLSRFRWDCEIPIQPDVTQTARALVYCGASYGYISEEEYKKLSRYKRRNMNMVLKINNEYVSSPCYISERYYF